MADRTITEKRCDVPYEAKLTIQLWKWKRRKDLFTVVTDTHSGGGTRIAGPKMIPGCANLVHEFVLDADDVQAIVDDYELSASESKETSDG